MESRLITRVQVGRRALASRGLLLDRAYHAARIRACVYTHVHVRVVAASERWLHRGAVRRGRRGARTQHAVVPTGRRNSPRAFALNTLLPFSLAYLRRRIGRPRRAGPACRSLLVPLCLFMHFNYIEYGYARSRERPRTLARSVARV